ncbi:MAG TPA: hypothetical protein VHM26_16395 [Chitinophagaceae bacterium]|nr:hypothetical protein [Chitinophagaceae bacterium]
MKILTNYISTLVKSVVMIFALVGVVSCQKNKDDNPEPEPGGPIIIANPALGYWQGHYRYTGFLENNNMKVLIKAGGIARVYDMNSKIDTADAAKTDGTWTYAANKLTVAVGNLDPIVFSGEINSNKWTGSWKVNIDVKGTFSLLK